MTDEELAVNGDKDAFKRLIEINKNYLFNIAIAILQNEDDCGDAIGETIIKAYKNINKLREFKYFKTWLTKILINECRKLLKLRKKTVFLEDNKIEISENNSYNDEKIDFKDVLKKLKKEQYDVLILFYYNDLKIKEIAKILKIPEGTVKSRLNTAKNIIYNKMYKEREM